MASVATLPRVQRSDVSWRDDMHRQRAIFVCTLRILYLDPMHIEVALSCLDKFDDMLCQT
jgi:hypothetical protein